MSTTTTTTEMDQLKAAHRVTWDSGDYASVAQRLVQEVADAAVAAADPKPGEEIIDVGHRLGERRDPGPHCSGPA